jgi:hypothetical protein
MASPITSWEGAEAIFTFADQPAMVSLILILAIAVTIFAIVATVKHENESYIDYKE